MAININNNLMNGIVYGGTPDVNVGSDVSANAHIALRQAANDILMQLRSMMPGDTLSGQLIAKDGNSIQLMIEGNTVLNTVLDQDVNVALGQQMSFEVKSNHDGQLTLRPLFANLSNSTNIVNALDAAGIPLSDETITMVDTLMQNGMPINKDMLQTINRECMLHPEADVRDIVMLHKMDIPVNDTSVNQMQMYRNNNQWMIDNVSDVASELTDMLFTSLATSDEGTTQIIAGLQEILMPELQDGASQEVQPNTSATQGVPASNGDLESDVYQSVKGTEQNTPGTSANVPADVKDMPVITKDNVFKFLMNAGPEASQNPHIRSAVKSALTELLSDRFLMEPEKVEDREYVTKYYEKTSDIANRLATLMSDTGKSDTTFAKNVSSLRDNLEFMNQVNELYNYVQLPLKMNNAQANGDLYVYARKRGRGRQDDDKLTALLHLSMEHLGNMDVFLTLREDRLSTKFCMEKEELLDFIESHIDELNARLAAKGYSVDTTVSAMEQSEQDVIKNIVKNDETNILLSTQSFDARA